jgi:hypothetical protein
LGGGTQGREEKREETGGSGWQIYMGGAGAEIAEASFPAGAVQDDQDHLGATCRTPILYSN